jgi:hypothetical protein
MDELYLKAILNRFWRANFRSTPSTPYVCECLSIAVVAFQSRSSAKVP